MSHHLKNQKDVQSHVKKLKNFYGELSVFVLVITVSLIIWLLCGGGYFWPLWIALIWGVVILLKASKLGIVMPSLYEGAHSMREKLPFIRPQWEGEKAQEIMKKMGKSVADLAKEEMKTSKAATKPKKAATKAKAAPKKKAKTSTKKAAPKKTAKKKTAKK